MHGSRKIPTSFSDKILRKRVCRKFSSIFRRAFRIITENAWFWENSNKIFREDTEKTVRIGMGNCHSASAEQLDPISAEERVKSLHGGGAEESN
ncbi:unnamed protein product [Brassica oleracea]